MFWPAVHNPSAKGYDNIWSKNTFPLAKRACYSAVPELENKSPSDQIKLICQVGLDLLVLVLLVNQYQSVLCPSEKRLGGNLSSFATAW